MYRVLLVNMTKSPDRQELVTSERTMGELFFSPFELHWAGYILLSGSGKLCANWIIPEEQVDEFCEFVETHELDGYQLAVFAPNINYFGGQTSERII